MMYVCGHLILSFQYSQDSSVKACPEAFLPGNLPEVYLDLKLTVEIMRYSHHNYPS